jgi:plastocyanin domain-containing protein
MKRARPYLLCTLGILALVVGLAHAADKPQEVKRFVATVGADGVQKVDVVGGEYYFDPNQIVVKANVPVELRVKKAGGFIPHDISIKAPEAGINFSESVTSEPKSIRFTPTKVGTYEFNCTKKLLWFESHKEKGMHGTLEVVP